MKSYKLNIKVLIAAVGIFSLLIFSLVLIIFNIAKMQTVREILLEYAYIIAPTSFLWIFADNYLWHTKLLQSIHIIPFLTWLRDCFADAASESIAESLKEDWLKNQK